MKPAFRRFVFCLLSCIMGLLFHTGAKAQDSAYFHSRFCRFWKPTVRVINGKEQPAKRDKVMFGYFPDHTYILSENERYGVSTWQWNARSKKLLLGDLAGGFDTFSIIRLNDTALAIQMRKPGFVMTQFMRTLKPQDSAEVFALLHGQWWVTLAETEINGQWEKDTMMISSENFSFCFSPNGELRFEDNILQTKDTSAWMMGYTPDEVLLQLGDIGFTRCFIQKLTPHEMVLETYAMGYAHRRLRFKRLAFECP